MCVPGELGQPHLTEVCSHLLPMTHPPQGRPISVNSSSVPLTVQADNPSHPGLFLAFWSTFSPPVSPTNSTSPCMGLSSAWPASPQAAFHTVVLMTMSSTQIPTRVGSLTPPQRRGTVLKPTYRPHVTWPLPPPRPQRPTPAAPLQAKGLAADWCLPWGFSQASHRAPPHPPFSVLHVSDADSPAHCCLWVGRQKRAREGGAGSLMNTCARVRSHTCSAYWQSRALF